MRKLLQNFVIPVSKEPFCRYFLPSDRFDLPDILPFAAEWRLMYNATAGSEVHRMQDSPAARLKPGPDPLHAKALDASYRMRTGGFR